MTPLAILELVHAFQQNSWSQSKVAEACGFPLRTVQRLLQRVPCDLGRRPGCGKPGKIHGPERRCIEVFDSAHPDAFLHQYVENQEQQCQVLVRQMTIYKHLKKMKFTLKVTDLLESDHSSSVAGAT